MKNTILALLTAALIPLAANASVKLHDNTGLDLGHFNDLKCGGNLDCTRTAGKGVINLVSSPDGLVQNQTGVSGDIAVSQCGGSFISNAATDHWVLPSISDDDAIGCRLTFIVGVTSDEGGINVNPGTAQEQILLLTNAAGDSVSADLAGESVTLEAIIDGLTPKWAPVGSEKGTWTDAN